MFQLFKNLYLNKRIFIAIVLLLLLFILAYIVPFMLVATYVLTAVLVFFIVFDIFLLFGSKPNPVAFVASRVCPEKLSNGDNNDIYINLKNGYSFATKLSVIDEIPFQFQKRDLAFDVQLQAQQAKTLHYQVRPNYRGLYSFGSVNVYVSSPIALVQKRYTFDFNKQLAVYPSFLQMRKYELIAFSNKLRTMGIKKIRRIGHSMDFEQIRDYVTGDDYRSINWKASARVNNLMVNQFQDEKSQAVYALIDKSRVMKMPFEGLSLLDYAINTSLAICNVVVKKGDKAGLISFNNKMGSFLAADARPTQIQKIQEHLYREETNFLESNYELLYSNLRRYLKQRSLLLLFTNFTSKAGLDRQLPYLRAIAKNHLLIVIFFVNTELNTLLNTPAKEDLQAIYHKAIAEKFALEQVQMVKELGKYGIQAILTPPKKLTINTLNKYLELKARGLI